MRFGRWMLAAALLLAVVGVPQESQGVEWSSLLASRLPAIAEDKPQEASDDRRDERMPYVAGIVGSSLNPAGGLISGSVPMGDAAIGVSIPRPAGAVRLELEGRQRTALASTAQEGASEEKGMPVSVDGQWTTLANAWRDVTLSEHAAVYAGGGAGVGGYRESAGPAAEGGRGRVTDVAWQVGGGATYSVTDRVTLDAGYRYYGVGADRHVEPAGEVVFAVRISDPFRGWLRD